MRFFFRKTRAARGPVGASPDMARTGLLAVTLAFALAGAAGAAKTPIYILNGYSFGGLPPSVNTAELIAKFKDQEGARITRADVDADQAILAKELRARHIEGQLFSTIAEKHGRVWIIFDLQVPGPARHLTAQNFEGESRLSESALAAATGLKPGDTLPPARIELARRAILAAYAKSMPGKLLSLKARIQTTPDGAVTLTWIVGEPK